MVTSRLLFAPIFVLGSARSGTTALSNALAALTELPNPREGHVWPLINSFARTATKYRTWLESTFQNEEENCLFLSRSQEEFETALVRTAMELFDLSDKAFIDKTPGVEMIKATETLANYYQRAFFVFIRRHPIATIRSKKYKFPTIDFATHCQDWVTCLEAWRDIKPRVAHRSIEIDYAELVAHPLDLGARLGRQMALGPGGAERFAENLTRHMHVERTQPDRSDVPSIHSVSWTDLEKATFLQICEDAAISCGYDIYGDSTEERYDGELCLFLPRLDNEACFVAGRNGFCYPINDGFQLCPNPPGQDEVSLTFLGVKLRGRRRLSFTLSQEFIDGPDVMVRVEMFNSSSGRSVFIEQVPAVPRVSKLYDFALTFEPDVVDIAITPVLVGGNDNAYATVKMHDVRVKVAQ